MPLQALVRVSQGLLIPSSRACSGVGSKVSLYNQHQRPNQDAHTNAQGYGLLHLSRIRCGLIIPTQWLVHPRSIGFPNSEVAIRLSRITGGGDAIGSTGADGQAQRGQSLQEMQRTETNEIQVRLRTTHGKARQLMGKNGTKRIMREIG